MGRGWIASMTAVLTAGALVGWPVALIGTTLIAAFSLVLIWVLGSSERTRRLVKVISAVRSSRRLPTSRRRARPHR